MNTVELRADQWYLIVIAMARVRKLSLDAPTEYAVDAIGRKLLRRNIDEILAAIKDQTGIDE